MMEDTLKNKLAALGVRMGTRDIASPVQGETHKLDDLVSGTIRQTMFGETLVIEKRYPAGFQHGTVEMTTRPGAGWIALLTKQGAAVSIPSDQFIYLDVETTSLSTGAGSYPFLIGLCQVKTHAVEVAQLMMRTLSEERAMLAELVSQCQKARVVITYNGAAFDLPMIRSRLAFHSIPDPFLEMIHIDLLPVTRKLWKNTLPSRSLSHLEMTMLGVSRSQEEVPGYLIPQIYFDYLRTGAARPLLGVLYHNEMDILSLAGLFNYLADDTASLEIIHQLPAIETAAILKILLDLDEKTRLRQSMDELDSTILSGLTETICRQMVAWCKRNEDDIHLLKILEVRSSMKEGWAALEAALYYERRSQDRQHAVLILQNYLQDIENSNLSPFSKQREMDRVRRKIERLTQKPK